MSKKLLESMKESIIPAVHRMIEKEEEHIKFLKENIHLENAKEYLTNSEDLLKHYKQRLQEYQDYVEKLKRES